MIAKPIRLSRLTVLAALALTACSGGGRPNVETGPTNDSLAELEALYKERTERDRLTVSEADVHFMTGMIGHHAQALVMSRLAPTHGASPQVRILTARIINAQTDEIAVMQQWLADRDRPVPEFRIEGTTLTLDGPEHAMHMPGMLTADQLRKLDKARGTEFDRLFLTYMIQHHNGAVTMVRELFATDGAAQDGLTFKLASDVQVDQITEIERMGLMLEAMPTAGGTP